MTNFENNAQYGNLQVVTLGKLDKCQKNGIISIALPDRKQKVDFKVSQIIGHKENDMSWYGKAVDENGYAMIISKRGTKSVYINLGGNVYETQNLEGETHILFKRNKPLVDVVCKEGGGFVENEKPKKKGARVDVCSGPVKILVLYTANAENDNPIGAAWVGVSQFNLAIYNNKLPSFAKLQLVAVEKLWGFTEEVGGNLLGDVNNLKNNPYAQQLRNQYDADVVVLIIKSTAPDFNGRVATVGPDNNNAYAVVKVEQATNYVMAHEIGHLFGARHETDGATATRKAYETSSFVTIMKTSFNNVPGVIPYFSDPNSYYGTNFFGFVQPVGDATHNNFEAIYSNGFVVNMFRNAIPYNSLTSYIAGNYSAKAGTNVVCEAITNCGTYPYTYQWQVSTDGYNYSGVVGTGEYLNYTMPYADNLFIMLTVYSTDGQGTQAYWTINRRDAPFSRLGIEENSGENNDISQITISPNPSNDESVISFKLKKEQKIKLAVSATDGKLQNVLADGVYDAGNHEIKYNTSQLKSGMYLCNLSTEDGTIISQKIIVNH
jgi:Metallo-peptidase family M12B Reprolysin-like/Secretion system C-terminal sorting domain